MFGVKSLRSVVYAHGFTGELAGDPGPSRELDFVEPTFRLRF